MQVIEFECRGHRFGVPLACVRRVVMSAALAPLPGAAEPVMGVINLGGEAVTVLDFAGRAGLGATVLAPSQQFLVLELAGLRAALVVDRIGAVAERTPQPLAAHGGTAPADYVAGVVRLDDGLCLVLDPDRFLFEHEKFALAAALAGAGHA